ncbi:MAG TPA: low affinity iron permease family protein [Tahibacter sp.]|nr:low affinity iron permease family protein [Tahibacter sp.]
MKPQATTTAVAPPVHRHSLFDRLAGRVTHAVGTPGAFALAVLSVVVWGATGPLFGFSETWQLVINTGTTIVTFLMVFVIQQSQNKDSVALHLKLNELIASHRQASNRLIAIEDLDEEELRVLREFYGRLAGLAAQSHGVKETHSLDEADERHEEKRRAVRH